jgi:hypothetical protein
MFKQAKKKKLSGIKTIAPLVFSLAVLFACINTEIFVQAFEPTSSFASTSDLKIAASIEDGQTLAPEDKIELKLSRDLKKDEGRLAIFIAQTDLTSLFTRFDKTLTYNRKILPLPVGENALTVYLVSPSDQWQEIAHFTLRVANQKNENKPQTAQNEKTRSANNLERVEANANEQAVTREKPAQTNANEKPDSQTTTIKNQSATTTASNQPAANATTTQETAQQATAATKTRADASTTGLTNGTASTAPAGATNASTTQTETTKKVGGFDKLNFIPSITLGFKSQAAETHFPDANRPFRPTFADTTLQASFRSEATRGIFTSQTQFDLAGSSFQQEALQFGRLANDAPQIDLASYLMQFQIGKAKFLAGHTAYGSNRHLINSFSSRGLTMTLPISANFDFSFAAMNGTSIVGFDNFFGLDKRKHQLMSGTLGVEFLPKRAGGARLEISALSGYLLPVSNVNQGNVNDAERSKGLGFRFTASDPKQRFRFDGGFTRSQFFSPSDPLLNQGFTVVAVPAITRNARYLETGFDILKDVELTKSKRINLTFNFRHEYVDPLYRSLAASTQADKINNQFELIANIGEINAQISHIRFNDNLNNIPSILKSLTRAERVAFSAPLVALFGKTATPNQLLPRLSYSFDRLHQFGAAIPKNGGFEFAPEAIPNFLGTNQSFTSEWQFEKVRLGYRANHSLQNNQQLGRELADLINFTNAVSAQINAAKTLDVNLEFSADNAKNQESRRTDRLLRLSTGINWRVTQRNLVAANLSATFAGDVARTVRNRNAEFDFQWSYQFTLGKERFKKLQGQSFIRYANRYANSRDNIFFLNNLTKAQTLNIGLSFTFF